MQKFKIITVLLLLLSPYAFAQDPDIQRVTAASYAGDIAALEAMHAEVDEISYPAAYLKYRLAVAYYAASKSDKSDDLLAETVADLKQFVSTNPDSADAYALLATSIGMRISFRPAVRGITMGASSDRAIKRAQEIDPLNPRVWLIKGIAAHNTPTMFGGGNKKALTALDEAISIYATDASGWGQADAYIWRGLTHQSNGDKVLARADFQAALAASPNYSWAESLLNNLDAKS